MGYTINSLRQAERQIKIRSETFNPNKTVAENDESYENLFHFDANYDRRSFIRLRHRQKWTCSQHSGAAAVSADGGKFN